MDFGWNDVQIILNGWAGQAEMSWLSVYGIGLVIGNVICLVQETKAII